MSYCADCCRCCPICGDPELESCASCDDARPDQDAQFWTIVSMITFGLIIADAHRRSADA